MVKNQDRGKWLASRLCNRRTKTAVYSRVLCKRRHQIELPLNQKESGKEGGGEADVEQFLFGEGENKPSYQTIQRLSDWYKITKDETIVIKDVRIYNEENIEVTTIKKDGACQPNCNMNIFVAIFRTASARLKLYESLEKL